MQHIDRLLYEARRTFRPNAKNGVAFVDYDERSGKWVVSSAMVWDGVFGSGNMDKDKHYEKEYKTQEQASEAMHSYFKTYGIEEDEAVVIFISRLED